MTRHSKRAHVLIAAIALGLTPLIAYGAAQADQAAAAGPMPITWHWEGNDDREDLDTWGIDHIEEMFDVDIAVDGINYFQEKERVELMLANGQFPDFGYLSGSHANTFEIHREGVTRSIPMAMIREHAPMYAKLLDDSGYGWMVNANPANADEVLSLMGAAENVAQAPFNGFVVFRHDWASKAGLPMPGYEDIKEAMDPVGLTYFYDHDFSIADIERFLVAARDDDLDGNGKQDTIPLGASETIDWSFEPFLNMYGLTSKPDYTWEVGGELHVYNTHPRYEDFLKLLAGWYSDGLIDTEFPTLTRRKKWEKETLRTYAISTTYWNYNVPAGEGTAAPGSFAKLDEDVDVIMTWPPVGPGGVEERGMARHVPFALGSYHAYINADVSDEKLERILQIYDWMMMTDEGYALNARGQEGVHFDWEGEPWSSRLTFDAERVKDGRFYTYPPMYTIDRLKFLYYSILHDWAKDNVYSGKGYGMLIYPARYDLFNETGYNDKKVQYGDALNTLRDEFYLQAVTGKVDVDAEWDAHVERWMSIGGAELLAELAKAPRGRELFAGQRVY